jgi:hypothetical protein
MISDGVGFVTPASTGSLTFLMFRASLAAQLQDSSMISVNRCSSP